MTQPHFILASSSPRRQELIQSLGIRYTIIKPEIDETRAPGESPLEYVQRLSREKAHAVESQLEPPAMVLAADTVVILATEQTDIPHGDILEKPANNAEARQMLLRLRARPHWVCTSVTLVEMGPRRRERTEVAQTQVHMRAYSDDEIAAYIASGDPFDKAGGYAIQNEAFHPVDHIEGSYTNVVGLPVEMVKDMLSDMGWTLNV